jgi:hypothetical protein
MLYGDGLSIGKSTKREKEFGFVRVEVDRKGRKARGEEKIGDFLFFQRIERRPKISPNPTLSIVHCSLFSRLYTHAVDAPES